ncbi:MAG: (d)CMP kinase [Paludibacteraceae bacterium]|nr:(d)CMP kinase [Paludibacteraceae bacterium]
MIKPLIVAIDGYSSCGKSTIAKALAKHACSTYVDTGAMYRAVALFMTRQNVTQPESIVKELAQVHIDFTRTPDGAQHVTLNGEDVESQIRTLEIGNRASEISQIKEVRAFLVAQQQKMGEQTGVVMDGRDIGTVVFPNADLKLFLTARPEVRAQRRFNELVEKGQQPVYEEVLADVNARDYRDTHRAESPLRQAEDAIVVDNSDMTPDEQLKVVCELYDKKFQEVYDRYHR